MHITFSKTNRDFITEKIFSCAVALGIVLTLLPQDVSSAYIILGHAHFVLTYIYQVKSGRVRAHQMFLFAALATALFSWAQVSPNGVTLFAASALIYHTYFSDMGILKRKMSWPYFLAMSAIMAINGIWLVNVLWDKYYDATPVCYLVIGVASCGALMAALRKKAVEVDAFFVFLLLVLLGYMGLAFSGYTPSPYKTYGFIVITHYMTSYVATIRQLHARNKVQNIKFLMLALVLNIAMFAGFVVVTHNLAQMEWLYMAWYMPVSFYVWTLLHFASTATILPYLARFSNRAVLTYK